MLTYWLCTGLGVGALILAELLVRYERRRITAAIEVRGGRIQEIVWRGFERVRHQGRSGRAYDVTFDDKRGMRRKGRAFMRLFAAPQWITATAPERYRSETAVIAGELLANRKTARLQRNRTPSRAA